MERLRARFTPVNIPSVQTSLFHDRKQRAGESVDEYAQDLQQLFLKAYPQVQQGSSEAKQLGKSVLASQFVAGLRGNIKLKLAGSDGNFDHLLTRARIEEDRDSKSSGQCFSCGARVTSGGSVPCGDMGFHGKPGDLRTR